jgi:hypothetical protein
MTVEDAHLLPLAAGHAGDDLAEHGIGPCQPGLLRHRASADEQKHPDGDGRRPPGETPLGRRQHDVAPLIDWVSGKPPQPIGAEPSIDQ